jgi:hypothetical protein
MKTEPEHDNLAKATKERYVDVPEYDDVYDPNGRLISAPSVFTEEELEAIRKKFA